MAQQSLSGTARQRHRHIARLDPYLWILPAVVVYGIFKLVPLASGLYMALLRWDGIEDPRFIGLRNFRKILNDDLTIQVLLNNVEYAVGTVVGKIVLSLFLAVMLNQALRGRNVLPHQLVHAGRDVIRSDRHSLALAIQCRIRFDQHFAGKFGAWRSGAGLAG